MAIRSAEVKAYVTPDVKAEAESGVPFDMRTELRPAYDASTVLPTDPRWGSSLLPTSMDDDDDGAYDHLVR